MKRQRWTDKQIELLDQLVKLHPKRINWAAIKAGQPEVWEEITRGRSPSSLNSGVTKARLRLKQARKAQREAAGQGKGSPQPAASQPGNNNSTVNFCPHCGYRLTFINRAVALQENIA